MFPGIISLRRLTILGAAGLLLSCAALAESYFVAQIPSSDQREIRIRFGTYHPVAPAIAIETTLVEMAVTVRDHQGKIVRGLTAADFKIMDGGKERPVTLFSTEEASPSAAPPLAGAAKVTSANPSLPPPSATAPPRERTIAFFVDDTHGGMPTVGRARAALERFLAGGIKPGDRAGLFTTSGAVSTGFTSDATVLLAAAKKLELKPRRPSGMSECPRMTAYQAYVIDRNLDARAEEIAVAEAVACRCPPPVDDACIARQRSYVHDMAANIWNDAQYDSMDSLEVLRNVVRILAKAPGDRLLLMLSPGFVTGGMEEQVSAVLDTALAARIVISSLDSEGLVTDAEVPERRRVDLAARQMVLPEFMAAAAAATGGKLIQNNNDFAGSLERLAAPPEFSYLLGFSPTAAPDDEYHKLKITVREPAGAKVETRAGYFYGRPERGKETAQQHIDRVVSSGKQVEEFPVSVVATPGAPQGAHYPIAIHVSVDAKHLSFSQQNGRSVQELTFVTVLRDSAGKYVTGQQAVMDLFLTPETLARLQAEGIHATLSLAAPAGNYRVREVVREAVKNRLAASNVAVNLP